MSSEFRAFVGGLAWATDDRALEQAFSRFGQVLESKVISDRETGRSRGFGFVTFADENALNAAITEMNGSELEGRQITVNQAQSRQGGGGGGSRGGYGGGRGGYGGGGGGYGGGGGGYGSGGGYGQQGGYGGQGGGQGGYGGRGGGGGGQGW